MFPRVLFLTTVLYLFMLIMANVIYEDVFEVNKLLVETDAHKAEDIIVITTVDITSFVVYLFKCSVSNKAVK